MWLFANFGFFSIVKKNHDDLLTIRSRTQGDLLRLKRHYLPALSNPVYGAGSDYPWRAQCMPTDLAAAMAEIVGHLDYSNFKNEVSKTLGPDRAHRYGEVWDALYDSPEDLPEPNSGAWDGLPWPAKSPSGFKRAFGAVVIDPNGRILLREVANHFDGYVWTFPKGRPDAGENPRQTALREVEEEAGVRPRILLPIPGNFEGSTTRNHYFLMVADPADVDLSFRSDETARLRWADASEARDLISQTTNPTGRERDIKLLEAALSYLPEAPPFRRAIARSQDWVTRPMPAKREQIHIDRSFSATEIARIAQGVIPNSPDDRWFAYFEDGILHFHRSWTGYEIFRVRCEPNGNANGQSTTWKVSVVEINRHPNQYGQTDDQSDRALVLELIDGLLARPSTS